MTRDDWALVLFVAIGCFGLIGWLLFLSEYRAHARTFQKWRQSLDTWERQSKEWAAFGKELSAQNDSLRAELHSHIGCCVAHGRYKATYTGVPRND